MKIYNCFRRDDTNAGDWHSPPFRYFPELGDLTLESTSDELPKERSIIICGGGGLISPKKGFQKLRRFFGKHICIGWGLGENWIDLKSLGYLQPAPQTFPDFLSEFDLLGIRDAQPDYPQVPCASCMHEAFDQSYEIRRSIGVYEHKRIPLATYGHESASNNGESMEDKIRFIGESETIITNSYHGAYWAMLLNRRVICAPFGSKFFGFGENLEFRPPWNLRPSETENLVSYPGYLEKCRKANTDFKEKVFALLAENGAL